MIAPKSMFLAVLLSVCMLPYALQAQQQKPIDVGSYEHVAQVYSVKPRVGMEDKFEDALKQHFEWLRAQADNWSWETSQVLTGDEYGGYEIATFEHRWKDFDVHADRTKAERRHWNQTVAPFTERITCSFYKGLPEISFGPAQDYPTLYKGVKYVHVKLDRVPEYREAMRKQQEAIVKTQGLPGSEWYQMVRGRIHPLYIWVIPMKSLADLEPPTGGNRPEMVIRAFGPDEGHKILTQLNETVESYHSEIHLLRRDLSYIPGQQGTMK